MTDQTQVLLENNNQIVIQDSRDPTVEESSNKIRSLKKIQLPPIKNTQNQLRPNSLDMSASNVSCKSPLTPLKKLPFKSQHYDIENRQKLKQAFDKKHNLLIKLQKIDGCLTNIKNQHQLAGQRLNEWHRQKQSKLMPYLSKMKVIKQNISPQKHQKNIQLLQKINFQKMERQQRLLNQFKKRTQDQLHQTSLVQLQKIYGTKNRKGSKIQKKVQKINENLGKYPQTIKQQEGFGLNSTYEKSALKSQVTCEQQSGAQQ